PVLQAADGHLRGLPHNSRAALPPLGREHYTHARPTRREDAPHVGAVEHEDDPRTRPQLELGQRVQEPITLLRGGHVPPRQHRDVVAVDDEHGAGGAPPRRPRGGGGPPHPPPAPRAGARGAGLAPVPAAAPFPPPAPVFPGPAPGRVGGPPPLGRVAPLGAVWGASMGAPGSSRRGRGSPASASEARAFASASLAARR